MEDDDFDVLANGQVVGRIFKANAGRNQVARETAPSGQNSGAGIPGKPGSKSGPAAKPSSETTTGSDTSDHNRSVRQQDSSKIPGQPGSESGPSERTPFGAKRAKPRAMRRADAVSESDSAPPSVSATEGKGRDVHQLATEIDPKNNSSTQRKSPYAPDQPPLNGPGGC
jgi:hypothetical protein